ncbi:hypothetical protein RGQ21_44910 [Kitasatospora aureofaciens]|nr:hypothetical protein RGQ21_44910 [Kitasatospora aureofaciens]
MMSRRSPSEPSLLVALWWLLLAAIALVMFLGEINFPFNLNDEPTPSPTVTVTETQAVAPDLSDDCRAVSRMTAWPMFPHQAFASTHGIVA